MKKLMTIAAAALCTTVFGAIESTNVVGYQNSKVNNGARAMRSAATFLLVGNKPTEIKISDITQTAGDPGDLTLCLYNDNVTRLAQYIYFSAEAIAAMGESFAPGWYLLDAEGDPQIDLGPQNADLPYGQGCVINSVSDVARYTSSGQVDSIKREFTVNNGARKMMGNILPRTVNLSEITQSVGDPGDLTFCIYDDNVTRLAQYIYFSAEVIAAMEESFEPGWYILDSEGDPDIEGGAKDLVLDAGKGFVVNSVSDTAVLKFPKAM